MGRKPSLKRRVKSAVDGATAGGLEVARVKVDRDENITLFIGKPMESETDDTNTNPWDEVLIDAANEKRAS